VEGPCEHGIEPSGSIKCWEVLEAPQEGLSSVSTCKRIIITLYYKTVLVRKQVLQHYELLMLIRFRSLECYDNGFESH
jgi:hypothetical protein